MLSNKTMLEADKFQVFFGSDMAILDWLSIILLVGISEQWTAFSLLLFFLFAY